MNSERALEQVAERYRGEGYQVILEPGPDQLPSFAAGHDVDLMAFRNGEQVLVQVKVSREELQSDMQIVRTAEVVNDQAGWRFDLVVVNPESLAYRLSPEAHEPPVDQILLNLAHAEQMANAGELPMSFVMSWAALEAAMRRAAKAAGIDVRNSPPSFLLRALYAEGLLKRKEFDQLNDAMKIRNSIVHGMTIQSVSSTGPQYLASVARKLLAESEREPIEERPAT